MDFCDKKCLLCDYIGVRPINYSKYHKICQYHLNTFENHILTFCKHCHSNILIIRDFIFCSTCNQKECQIHPGNHNTMSTKLDTNINREIINPTSQKKENINIVDIPSEVVPENNICKKCHLNAEKKACLECKEKFCSNCHSFEQYCSNCLNNINDCDNCGKVGMIVTL